MVKQLKEQARTVEGAHELFKYCPRVRNPVSSIFYGQINLD